MSIPWSLPIFLAVAVLLLIVYSLGSRLFTATSPSPRVFWCPFRNVNAHVSFKESAWDGEMVDVEACSAFAPPTDVRCDKACLALKRLPGLRAEASPVPETRYWVW